MRVEDAGVGMILTQDVLDERGNLLLEKGIKLTRNYIARLKRLGVTTVTVTDPYAESLKQNKILNPEIRTELNDCFSTLFSMKAADILNFKPPVDQIQRLNTVIENVIDDVGDRVDQAVNAHVRQPSVDETQHAVNVCLLSIITGIYLKFERKVIHELALGALLHDLGKSMLPYGDKDKSYLHTIYGRELLFRSNLSPVISRIAAEHHESFDGSGYPKALTGRDIHPLSRLVCIANYFDIALKESAENKTPRQEIVEEMMGAGNTRFDLNLLRAFLNNVALFPVGGLVRLNNGKTAYVINNRVHFPLRPMVRIVEDYGFTDIDLVLKPNVTITDLIAE